MWVLRVSRVVWLRIGKSRFSSAKRPDIFAGDGLKFELKLAIDVPRCQALGFMLDKSITTWVLKVSRVVWLRIGKSRFSSAKRPDIFAGDGLKFELKLAIDVPR